MLLRFCLSRCALLGPFQGLVTPDVGPCTPNLAVADRRDLLRLSYVAALRVVCLQRAILAGDCLNPGSWPWRTRRAATFLIAAFSGAGCGCWTVAAC
jgi:hypothetical protein